MYFLFLYFDFFLNFSLYILILLLLVFKLIKALLYSSYGEAICIGNPRKPQH